MLIPYTRIAQKMLPLLLALFTTVPVQASDVSASVTIAGEVAPGVYGRVDIGTRPPPQLVYTKPVVIVQQPAVVRAAPLYMHVPPGHAKNWGKHCHNYNACAQPVYFVKSAEYEVRQRGSGKHSAGNEGKSKCKNGNKEHKGRKD